MLDLIIGGFTEAHRQPVTNLMILLQETERTISSDRRVGTSMAAGHIDYLLNLVQAQDGAFLTAVRNNQVIGFLVVVISSEDPGDEHLKQAYRRYGEITDMIVEPDHRGQGIAKRLLDQAILHVRGRNLSRIKVTALEGNQAAAALYRSTGFKPSERTFVLDV